MGAMENYNREFIVRYRLPRPVSRAYEAVCFALNEDDVIQRSRWCANVAVRFMAALKQACCLARIKKGALNPPSHYDFKRKCEGTLFPEELEARVPHQLLQLAEIYPGKINGDARTVILEALEKIHSLARYRLAVIDKSGFNVLFGPRIEYLVRHDHPGDFMKLVPVGTPMLVNPLDGHFLTLSPLVIWMKDLSSPFGHLYMLRRIEGMVGQYVEDGIPGSPSTRRLLSGSPVEGFLPVQGQVLRKLELPQARFHDGSNIENRYDILGLIWRGGISDIFIARRCDNRKLVVLKTYEGDSFCFDENYRFFVNEERFGGLVNHINVAKPKKMHLGPYGTVYEEELVQRGSLNDLINSNGVLTTSMALDFTVQLLDALEAIHLNGIVHNDIKPDNILFDKDGSIKLIDFGIASMIKSSHGELRPGVVPGSRGYMAPELTKGSFPGIKSDIFSVGVVLSEMLSGELPGSPAEVRTIKEIPVEFYDFLDKCLAENPHKRFSSASEAKEAMKAIHVSPPLAITLDVEGTLINNFYEKNPRPGLYEFITFCMENFDRVFIYTTLDEKETSIVFECLSRHAFIPESFFHHYEYVHRERESYGSFKDLRRCRHPLEQNAIVDDTDEVIPEDQVHRWIRVPEYSEVNSFDRGLFMARNAIVRKFGLTAEI